jgi:hypothetical protein
MPEPATRKAARTATIVAVPAALLVGVIVFYLMSGGSRGGGSTAEPPRLQATSPVLMPAPPLSEHAAPICRALVARLPEAVRDLARRPVSTGTEQNAAYGDPPLTVACGTAPVSYPADASLWSLSKVCWYADQRPDGTVWTTVDREIPVTVTVPSRYEGPGDWVATFSEALNATVQPVADIPKACR